MDVLLGDSNLRRRKTKRNHHSPIQFVRLPPDSSATACRGCIASYSVFRLLIYSFIRRSKLATIRTPNLFRFFLLRYNVKAPYNTRRCSIYSMPYLSFHSLNMDRLESRHRCVSSNGFVHHPYTLFFVFWHCCCNRASVVGFSTPALGVWGGCAGASGTCTSEKSS